MLFIMDRSWYGAVRLVEDGRGKPLCNSWGLFGTGLIKLLLAKLGGPTGSSRVAGGGTQ